MKKISYSLKIISKLIIFLSLGLFIWTGFRLKGLNECGQVNYIWYSILYVIILFFSISGLLHTFFNIGNEIEKKYSELLEKGEYGNI